LIYLALKKPISTNKQSSVNKAIPIEMEYNFQKTKNPNKKKMDQLERIESKEVQKYDSFINREKDIKKDASNTISFNR